MAQVIRLADHKAARRRRSPHVYFTRGEIHQLLSLYGRRVAAGVWRDYAIDCRPGAAVFAAYRCSNQRPAFTAQKLPNGFVVVRDDGRRFQAATLEDALARFEHKLTLAKP